jgi:helix-turn-helix protein
VPSCVGSYARQGGVGAHASRGVLRQLGHGAWVSGVGQLLFRVCPFPKGSPMRLLRCLFATLPVAAGALVPIAAAPVIELARTFGCGRVVFNDGLRLRRQGPARGEKYISDGELSRRLITEAKQTAERAWLPGCRLWCCSRPSRTSTWRTATSSRRTTQTTVERG